MDDLRKATDGSEPMAAYATGWLDGLLWMLLNGRQQAQHLHGHVVDDDMQVIWDLSLRAMALVFLHYDDIWAYVEDGSDVVPEMSKLQPPCAVPGGPHLGPSWVKPPNPN